MAKPFPGSLLAILLAAPATAHAAGGPDDRDKVLPCRPTIACTADLVSPGSIEIEAGYLYRHLDSGPQRTTPFLLKLTLAPWVQLQVGSNGYTAAEGARYMDNVVLGAKFHLFDQRGYRPALAFSAAVSMPTPAGQEGYLRMWDLLFTAYGTKDFGPVHADLNVGLDVFRLDGGPVPQGWGALALSADLVAPFSAMLEGYAFSNAAPASTRDGGILFAITHSPRKWLTFDIGGDVGVFPSLRAFSVFMGLTIIPAVFWR